MKNNRITNWIKGKLVVPTVHSLDNRMKRIVALSSLVGLIYNSDKRNKAIEHRLSKTMGLAVNSNSLTLPMLYHKVFWCELDVDNPKLAVIRDVLVNDPTKDMSEHEVDTYTNILVENMPTYLFYDSIENIKVDIRQLVQSIPFIFCEPATA